MNHYMQNDDVIDDECMYGKMKTKIVTPRFPKIVNNTYKSEYST